MSELQPTVLPVAYMPLIDCAPLVAARRLGLDLEQGIRLDLQRQASWAAVRDRLLAGQVQAAHALASLVYSIELGVGGPRAPMAVLMTLNQNGQAITLARPLAEALRDGQALPAVLAALGRRARLAQTFPTGTHALWLNYWLAASGVDPRREVDMLTIPPPWMPQALEEGLIDGYCCGEPWAALAEAGGYGLRVIRSGSLWPGHPEKVLACRRDFAALQPELAERLCAAVLAACRWLDAAPDNRLRCAQWLAAPEVIGRPVEQLAACLGEGQAGPQDLVFHDGGRVNLPWLSDGEWFLGQFQRWGWCELPADPAALLENVHRLDSYRRAAARVGVAVPAQARRPQRLFDQA